MSRQQAEAKCEACGKMVRDRPIIGSLHLCLTDEEFADKFKDKSAPVPETTTAYV